MNIIQPNLTEPGVSYFLRETLKQHNKSKLEYNTMVFNLILFVLFVVVVSILLIYKKKTKLSQEELKEKDIEKKTYIISKIKELNDLHQRKYNNMITNLPQTESEFEKMHKQYYNI